jgi:hypothetical protein
MKNNIIIDNMEEYKLYLPANRDTTALMKVSRTENNNPIISWEDGVDFNFIDTLVSKSQIYTEQEISDIKDNNK